MRKNILLIIMLLGLGITHAQRHDNIWLFGYSSNPTYPEYGGSVLDFSDDTLSVYYEYRDLNLDVTNASICDSMGNLLFYTNGISIANAIHEIMENGNGINPGEYADDHSYYGYILPQGALVLPNPGKSNEFFLIHMLYENPNGSLSYHGSKLLYTKIDVSLNNGLGAVVMKNQIIFEDILDHGKITAVKHVNGEDWWLLVSEYDTNGYHKVLLLSDSIRYEGKQNIGLQVPDGIGQAVFSPDGTKYVHYSQVSITTGNYLNIYDFDRCTGLLFNPIHENIVDSAWSGGVAISPNSQFLYVSSYNYIYQYDLWSDDILATKDTVAIYDGYEIVITPIFTLPTRFFLMQLGPDGRIYINCPTSGNLLHVINNPDLAGAACDVQQHSIELPTYNLFSMPNFPNYRLGALPDNACDTTISVAEPIIGRSVAVFPNPASGQITLEFEKAIKEEYEISLYSVTGQRQSSYKLPEGQSSFTLDIASIPAGLYFYKIRCNQKNISSGKIIIMKL